MPLPEVFGSWLLVRRLGGHAMTEVFVAVRLGDPGARWFVLKRPPLGERASGPVAEALRREARVLREAKGPGVVALEDAGELAGLPYLVVEHVRGAPLDRLIAAGPLPAAAARLVARDLARALAALHERGWVHGDVSPSNVMIDETGELVLLDFGLALRADEPREAPQGKAGYVSPQAALGKPAASSDDAYAWGVVAAEVSLGRRLFDHADLAQAAARTSLPPGTAIEGLPDVEPALADDASKRPALAEVAARIVIDAAARDELARLVAEEAARPEPAREEPGAVEARSAPLVVGPIGAPPLVEGRPLLAAPRGVSAEIDAPAAREAARGPASKAPPRRISRAVIPLVALALVGAFALGFVWGRRPGRTREGSITLPMLPARTEIAIDGRTMLVPEPGRAIPLTPGRHVLTLQAGRREARDYEIVVQPGEHVLVVNIQAATGGGRRVE